MKVGLTDALRRRVHRLGELTQFYPELAVYSGLDVRQTRAAFDLASSKTGFGADTAVDTFDDGAVRLHGTPNSTISSTTQNGYETNVPRTRPVDLLAWELDESIGAAPRLAKISIWLNRQFDNSQPRFDGTWQLQLYAVNVYKTAGGDVWKVKFATDKISVQAAAMASDQQLVDFVFSANGPYDTAPAWMTIDDQWRPDTYIPIGQAGFAIIEGGTSLDQINGRLIVCVVRAIGGSNNNFGLGRDSTLATTINTPGAGTLRHRLAHTTGTPGGNGAEIWRVTDGAGGVDAVGMVKATLYLGTYAAAGEIDFTGSQRMNVPGAATLGSFAGVTNVASLGANPIRCLAQGAGVLVAGLSNNQGLWSSTDNGATWTQRINGLQVNFVLFANSLFVAVAGTALYTSPDGITWTLRFTAAGGTLYGVAYGNGIWVVAGTNTAGGVVTSTDGVTWTVQTNPFPTPNPDATCVVFGGGKFVLGGTGRVATSTDGKSWTLNVSPPFLSTEVAVGACFYNGKFVIVSNTNINNATKLASSKDGQAWTVASVTGSGIGFEQVAGGGGFYVAVGSNSVGAVSPVIVTSTDAISWTQQSVANWVDGIGDTSGIRAVCFTGKGFAIGGGGAVSSHGQFLFVTVGPTPVGTIEFIVQGETPQGTTATAYARVNPADSWVAVADRQAPTDVGLAISTFYEMKWAGTSNAAHDSTPTLRRLGMADRVTYDLSDQCSLQGFDEEWDPLSGQTAMADGILRVEKTGVRDYRDLATQIASQNDFINIFARIWLGAPDIADRQLLHEYPIDNITDRGETIEFRCVSVLSKLRGQFPSFTSQLYGYVIKQAASDLTGGDDWTKVLSQGTETANTLSVTPAAAPGKKKEYAVTPAGVPGITRWPNGDITIQVPVSVANSNIYLSVAVARLDSTGALQEGGLLQPLYTAGEQQLTAAQVYSFKITNVQWGQAGSVQAATDRFRLELQFRNADAGGPHTVTIATGTINCTTTPPWLATGQQGQKVYTLTPVNQAFADWRDGQIGLAGRFAGSLPTATDPISYTAYDQDGKRELERLAWIAGGCIYASQGRVMFASMHAPNAATPAALFPLEQITPILMDPGFKARVPQFDVPYGYYLTNKDFAGHLVVQHSTAFTKFGISPLDNPQSVVEDETGKHVADSGLAQTLGQRIVQTMGFGLVVWHFQSRMPRPELDIGDLVAVETDQFTARDPNAGTPIVGRVVGVGRIIGTRGIDGREFLVWIRAYADLSVLTFTNTQRAPADLPTVAVELRSYDAQPQQAEIRLQPSPPGASAYWYYDAAGVTPPDRSRLDLWNLYTGPVTLTRDTAKEKTFSCFASNANINGVTVSVRVEPYVPPQIVSLSLAQLAAPNSALSAMVTFSPGVREVAFYRADDAGGTTWPTVGGTLAGALDPAKLTKRIPVKADGLGRYFDGTSAQGGFIDTGETTRAAAAPTYALNRWIQVIAVGYDVNGNVTARASVQLQIAAAASPQLTATGYTVSAAGSSCSAPRTISFTWTPNAAVVDNTHTLFLFAQVAGVESLLGTITTPKSVTSGGPYNLTAYASTVLAIFGTILARYRYELRNGSTVVDSGVIGVDDTFQGQTCALI